MVKRKVPTADVKLQNPVLLISRLEAESKLYARIELGRSLLNTTITSQSDYDQIKQERSKWDSFNLELLKRMFDNEAVAEEYHRVSIWGPIYMNMGLAQSIQSYKEGLNNKIGKIESIVERLQLIPEPASVESQIQGEKEYNNKNVFIVHGHDEAAKVNVARFLEKLGLTPIILHEQPNKGRTIIEKFEDHAAEVGFAVVLLTPDDIGAAKDAADSLRERARQNVILELGYFSGALGRDRVCVLYKDEVEIPNDYLGVVYTPLDSSGGWNLKLAKELKESGFDIDMNRAF